MKWNNLQEQETSIKVVLHACPKSLSCIMHQLVGVDPSNMSSNIKADVYAPAVQKEVYHNGSNDTGYGTVVIRVYKELKLQIFQNFI